MNRKIIIEVGSSSWWKNRKLRKEAAQKLKIIKMSWETKGARSVQSAVIIKGQTNFKNAAKDVLITSQLRTALIFNKLTKSTNYTIDTINGKKWHNSK